ncbi:hypothetical protein ACSHT0_11975 [Tepidicaulis sp. LMO-SS28]|uniref:hypothetical protein n=1 Tax=Tepidicaulis sp. LMO-SS28 TaxID=3447455 RepID=UPI003EE123CB
MAEDESGYVAESSGEVTKVEGTLDDVFSALQSGQLLSADGAEAGTQHTGSPNLSLLISAMAGFFSGQNGEMTPLSPDNDDKTAVNLAAWAG